MRRRIGEVWVDSGQVMIVDPCYLGDWKDNEFSQENPEDRSFSYAGACNATLSSGRADQLEHGAVASSTAYGDGVYPVYAERDPDGTIVRLVIEFDERSADDEPEEEDEEGEAE